MEEGAPWRASRGRREEVPAVREAALGHQPTALAAAARGQAGGGPREAGRQDLDTDGVLVPAAPVPSGSCLAPFARLREVSCVAAARPAGGRACPGS